MKQAQEERNDLLRYALQHPPANVTIKLPEGFDSFDNMDLALCPNPLPLYAEAEKAASSAKGGRAPTFQFDMKDCIVFRGGSSGGVQRAAPSPSSTRSKRHKSPREGPSSPEPRLESSSSPVAHNQRPSADSKAASPNPQAEPAAAATDHHGRADTQQRIVATEQSPPHSVTDRASPSIITPPAQPEPSKGFFGHIISTFRGLGAADTTAANGSNGSDPAAATTAARTQRSATSSRLTGPKARVGRTDSGSGLLASLWHPLASVRGGRNASQRACTASPASEDVIPLDTARRMEQLQIPLCGTTAGTMAETTVRQFGPVFEAVEEHRRTSGTAAIAATQFPRPPNIQLCEVLNSAPLSPFLDSLPVFAYDYLVICTNVLAVKRRDAYDTEMHNVYRRVFDVSDEQHRRTVANVTPPALRGPVDESDPAAVAEHRRYIADLRGDATLLRLLRDETSDDDYINRAEQLLYCIENYPDSPGDTHVPFAIRAMIYATCLLPLYQLDLSTLSPIYTEKDVANCLALLRSRLGISPQVEQYCHLHAQLLANDQCGSVEGQAVFLKDVARAVSSLGAQNIADSQLTPPVKYAYFVLQETFCLAAVPMPWLDSTFSYDMQRSVSAVFIETCLALPSCMLSAMLLVEDMPVMPPTANGETFLLSFMEVFVNSGVYRNYAERMGDDDNDGMNGPGSSRTTSDSPADLLQQASSGLDTKQKAYCKMLTRSFPLAMFLLVPGRLRIGAYTLLVRHWGKAYPDEQDGVPSDFQEAMDAFFFYLLGGCGGEKRPYFNERLSSLLVRASQTYLAPFSTLAKREESNFLTAATQLLEKVQLPWATTLDDAARAPHDVRRFLRTVFDAPRPPPLGSDPSSQHRTRLAHWTDTAASLLLRCMVGVPQVAPAASSAKMPLIAAEYERLRSVVAARNGDSTLLPGAVHRLHTIVQLRLSFSGCVARAHHTYELVRCVSGAPAVATGELQEQESHSIYEAVLQLCDTISVAILSSGTVNDLREKFMRLDAKQYQAMKQSHAKNEDFPMPRAYPDVTMRSIIDEVKKVAADVCAHLDFEPAVRQVYYRLGHNFVAYLFAVYVDGPGVFLSPADAPLIMADLDLVRVTFFETKPNASPDAAAVDAVSSACQAAAQTMRTSGAELLEKLYGIVQYVMSKSSAELTNGGVGVPPLHTLPESSDDSPWCQFVVRRVLDHRKDFKKSMWVNYQARQRTKTMY